MGAGELQTRILGTAGSEKLTVSSTPAVQFAELPQGATRAFVVVESNAIRYRKGGSGDKPTATDGIPVEAGQSVTFEGDLASVWLIRRDSSDATLQIEYYA